MHGGLPGRLWRRFIFLKNILINNKSVIYLFMFPPFPMIAKGPKYSSIDAVVWNLEWGGDRFCMLWNCSWSSAILQRSSHEAFLKTAQRIARNIQALQAVLVELYLLCSHCLSNFLSRSTHPLSCLLSFTALLCTHPQVGWLWLTQPVGQAATMALTTPVFKSGSWGC